MSRKECIFCNIVGGKSPETVIETENEEIVIFKDIKPASNVHFLAVSKVHFDSVKSLNSDHEPLIVNMHTSLEELLKSNGMNPKDALFGFHIPPFISVGHLHMHAIAPLSGMSYWSRIVFRPDTIWFKTVNTVRNMLKEIPASN